MSMPNSLVRCDGCDFLGCIRHRPITLQYYLPNGQRLEAYRRFAWCASCDDIVDAEKHLDADAIQAQITAQQSFNRLDLFASLLGKEPEDESNADAELTREKLQELEMQLLLARIRQSPPRCLKCGGTEIKNIGEAIHTCGGRLYVLPDDPDAPWFSYKSEVISLDVEGRRI